MQKASIKQVLNPKKRWGCICLAFSLGLFFSGYYPLDLKKSIVIFENYSQQIPGFEEGIKIVAFTGGVFTKVSPVLGIERSINAGMERGLKIDSFWMVKFFSFANKEMSGIINQFDSPHNESLQEILKSELNPDQFIVQF